MTLRSRTATVPNVQLLPLLMIVFLTAGTRCPVAAAEPPEEPAAEETVIEAESPAATTSAAAARESERIESLIERIQRSVVTIETNGRDGDQIGIGTGFIVDPKGLIATNLHVIAEGRRFEVQLPDESRLKVVAIEASDREEDLALIRVAPEGRSLDALELAEQPIQQGREVIAIGNPLGLRNSVVRGVVSAVREVDDRELIQLAMPIQPGNSGGPLIDLEGTVHGILNMKSAVDDNLGFAIPIAQLAKLRAKPNPVLIDRWVRFGQIDASRWDTLFGGHWQQRAGVISVDGSGSGFGGRSLCLFKSSPPEDAFDVAVEVRLEDESGAAGLVFHSDGENRHYGFYPSAGNLRLSCFRGPDVFSWQVLDEVPSEAYRPGEWNRLRVRVEDGRLRCYVNGELVIESTDSSYSSGRVGLAKFRDTRAKFRRFDVAQDLSAPALSDANRQWLKEITQEPARLEEISASELQSAGANSQAVARRLEREAFELTRRAERMQRLAADVRLAPVLERLTQLFENEEAEDLARGALLIAALDHPHLDVDGYLQRLEEMADEVASRLDENTSPTDRMAALDTYLFDENGFHGGRDEYYHPANSHLHRVIDEREGLPITLSILYIDLARRLGVQVDGIGLPGHFIVRRPASEHEPTGTQDEVTDATAETEPPSRSGQLIDVFDRGKTLSREDAATLTLQYAGRLMREDDLQAQSTEVILTRVLRNLIASARRESDVEALYRYTEGLVALAPENPQYRMMRVIILHQTNRDSRALDDLQWLIEQQPAGMDMHKLIEMRDFLQEP